MAPWLGLVAIAWASWNKGDLMSVMPEPSAALLDAIMIMAGEHGRFEHKRMKDHVET